MLAAVLLAAAGLTAYADSRIPGQEDISTRIRLNNREEFDTATGLFLFDVSGVSVSMNVPDGIVTNGAVSLGVPRGLTAKVYKDGNLLTQPDLENITEPGGYVVLLGNNGSFSLSFTIVTAYNRHLVRYNLPDGFSVQHVMHNGQDVKSAESSVDMKQEGSYVIDYGCEYIGRSYRLEVIMDHIAPTLTITGADNGYADGPVEVSDVEPGCTVTVLRDGEEIPFRSPFTGSGQYTVTVKDKAGNTSVYNFAIGLYFTHNRLTAFIILAAAIGALAAYMWISRKRLRIR